MDGALDTIVGVKLLEEKNHILDQALIGLNKKFGAGSVLRPGEEFANREIEVISTGALTLDMALGIGGIPRGRITEIFGPAAAGKTSLALHCIANVQKAGGIAAIIDAEHAIDPVYAESIGVNFKDLLLSQPMTGEEGLEILETLIRTGEVALVVVDSVASLVPQAELEGEVGQSHMALQARLMSQAMRRLTAVIAKTNTAVVFINQIREKVGIMFGSPETQPGGRALKFYAAVRLDIRQKETIKTPEGLTGAKVHVKIVKNKMAIPYKEADIDIVFGKGFSWEGSLVDAGVLAGVIQKSGAWYVLGEEKFHGREELVGTFKDNVTLAEDVTKQVLCHER